MSNALTILYVEDDEPSRKVMQLIMKSMGVDSYVAFENSAHRVVVGDDGEDYVGLGGDIGEVLTGFCYKLKPEPSLKVRRPP